METGQEVWVVTCVMDGCDEWNDGHRNILLITDTESLANKIQDEHEKMEEGHLHWNYVDVEKYAFNMPRHTRPLNNQLML